LTKFQDWFLEGNVAWVTWQKEQGENGTPHLQGYLLVNKDKCKSTNGVNAKWIKENINNKMHIEIRQGSHEQAKSYCNKLDTRVKGPWTLGKFDMLDKDANRKAVGERRKTSVAEVLEDAASGMTEKELWAKHPGHMTHYHKSVKAYMMTTSLGERQQPKIVVLWGPPGTGKSHRASQMAKAIGPAYRWQSSASGSVWFDGYDTNNHKVVIFDDFKGGMPYTMLLRLLDRYPMHVEGKGTAVPFNPEWIIITSNHPPNEWYFKNGEKTFDGIEKVHDSSALLRRVTAPFGKTIEMKDKYEELAPEFDIDECVNKLEKCIDLTGDDDDNEVAEYEETDENEFEEPDENEFSDFGDETEFPVTTQYEDDDLPPPSKLKRTLSFHKTPEAELVVEKPPALGSAGRFKKVGTGGPVQSLLRLKRARDDDEDVDDK